MSNQPNVRSCTHIKVTGVRCGSPALRGERFCYFHQRMLRTVKGLESRVHHAAILEDEESIQVSLMEVVNALLRGTIETKRAELVLRALNTAVRNIRRVKFGQNASTMVREIPDYPAPPAVEIDETARAEADRQATRKEIARLKTEQEKIAATHGAAGALARPGGPEVPGRSTLPPKPVVNPAQRKPITSIRAPEPPVQRKKSAAAR